MEIWILAFFDFMTHHHFLLICKIFVNKYLLNPSPPEFRPTAPTTASVLLKVGYILLHCKWSRNIKIKSGKSAALAAAAAAFPPLRRNSYFTRCPYRTRRRRRREGQLAKMQREAALFFAVVVVFVIAAAENCAAARKICSRLSLYLPFTSTPAAARARAVAAEHARTKYN